MEGLFFLFSFFLFPPLSLFPAERRKISNFPPPSFFFFLSFFASPRMCSNPIYSLFPPPFFRIPYSIRKMKRPTFYSSYLPFFFSSVKERYSCASLLLLSPLPSPPLSPWGQLRRYMDSVLSLLYFTLTVKIVKMVQDPPP